jgi:iron complex outermembrane receptor protein
MAGITPVSQGGDSIGGTVAVESRLPVFASRGERLHEEGAFTGFYRSNGENYGGSLTEWVAGPQSGLGYNGSWATNDDYTDGSGHKVTSTYAQSTDHTVTLAAQGRATSCYQAGLHHTPYEGFVNAQMDMVRNYAESLNLHYRRSFRARRARRARLLAKHLALDEHRKDKSTFPMPMWMPMNTHGRDLGYAVKFEAPALRRGTHCAWATNCIALFSTTTGPPFPARRR